MIFHETSLRGSYIVTFDAKADNRGWFARTYCKNEFAEIGHKKEWVQMNHSCSFVAGTLRGMHYQIPPHGEVKMIRCISGMVYDVIIDIRKNSPTFLNWFGVELSAENRKMIYVPEGFAHGFQTLTDNCEMLYLHTEYFTPRADSGLHALDPFLNISWPLQITEMSDRDRAHQVLTDSFTGV